jgi:amino-acid N-acetyltransferase
MVNAALAEELKMRVHALAIEAKSPDEALRFVELTPDDQRLVKLLAVAKLSTGDLLGQRFFGFSKDDQIVACGGLDIVSSYALLRSVAVDERERGKGLGRMMVLKLISEARRLGAGDVYLLTASAIDYFNRLDFKKINRAEVPEAIGKTSQFTGTACSSAQAMRLVVQ